MSDSNLRLLQIAMLLLIVSQIGMVAVRAWKRAKREAAGETRR